MIIDNHAALYGGDPGPGWQSTGGSTGVFINGRPALRVGDPTKHDDEKGEILQGSPDVLIGDQGPGTPPPEPHDKSTQVHVTDGLGRPVHGVTVTTLCPHDQPPAQTVDGSTSASGLCGSASVRVDKTLQTGTWDDGAARGPHPQASTKDAAPSVARDPAKKTDKQADDETSGDTGGTAAPVSTSKPTTAPPTIVHAPAPSTSSSGGVSVVAPTGPSSGSTHIVLATTHNWAELVYEAFGQHIPTGPMELALLGVRGASLAPARFGATPSEGSLESDAAAGRLSEVEFTTLSHVPTAYSDLLFCVWTDTSASDNQRVDVFECTIDSSPGKGELHLPALLEGTLFHAAPSGYEGYPGKDVALEIFHSDKEPVPPKVPSAAEVVATALSQRNTIAVDREYQKFGAWYGENGVYWCAEFVSWCFAQIGMPLIRYAYCPDGLNAFQNGKWGTFHGPTETAQPGDIVFYLFPEPDSGSTDHTGIVVSDAGSSIYTVEGNTSPPVGSPYPSTDRGVFYKNRPKVDIVGYGRPNYPPPAPSASSFIRWGSEAQDIKASSAVGSTVLHHHYFHAEKGKQVPDPAATRYRRFMQIFNQAKNKKAIPYLIVSSDYVTSYGDWATALSVTPTETPKPSSVINKKGLVAPEGYTERYLPSFMSKAFADRVEKEAASTHDAKKAAALRAALDTALFKVKG